MIFGVTAAGFVRKTFTDLQSSVSATLRAGISAVLDLSERDPLGNVVTTIDDALAELWEMADASYNAYDVDNADPDRFKALCLLTGVEPGGATKGKVTPNLDFDAGLTFAVNELVANVIGEPNNTWHNTEVVTTTTAGVYAVKFESVATGAGAVAPAGSLAVITTTKTGWNSITNPIDAVKGVDLESLEDLRVRREASIAITGSGTIPAIKADVGALAGIISVNVAENTSDTLNSDGLPPHSYSVVIWDGPTEATPNNTVAQSIFDSRPAGIPSIGNTSGTATARNGSEEQIDFSRATQIQIQSDMTITTDREVDLTTVVAQIIASHNDDTSVDVNYNLLNCSVFKVPGVTNWVTSTIGIVGQPQAAADVEIGINQVGLINSANVTVTVVPG